MSQHEVLRGHRFNIETAEVIAEIEPLWVGKTPSGTWFIYSDNEGAIEDALLPGDDVTSFAELLVSHGFAEVVLEHFPAEEHVIPEA